MTQTQALGKIGYGATVRLTSTGNSGFNLIRGSVAGRVKDSDLYLVLFDRSIVRNNGFYRNLIDLTYGHPNRNLELEWGKYNGYWNEFIVPKNDLELIV